MKEASFHLRIRSFLLTILTGDSYNLLMREKILTKNFIFAFLSLFCSAMVMYMLLGTVTEYAEGMGTTVTLAGLVSGIYVFGGLCSRLGSGVALQKLGWKRLAIIAMAVHFVACCCYFLVDGIAMLIIVRFVHGLGFGASANATMTIGMSILPKSRYGEATGYFMMATTLAVAAGPFAGGLVYDGLGPIGCFAMASILSFLMLVFIALMDLSRVDPGPQAKIESRREGDDVRGLDKLLEVKAFPVSVCILLCAVGYAAIMSFYRLYAAEVDLVKEFAYYFLFYGGFLLASRPLAGKLQDKYGDNIVCIPGIIAQTIGLILLAWQPCMLTIILCALGCALGFGTLNSACNAIVCRNAGPERRPYAITTFWICCDGGVGIGPTLLGAVVTASGFTTMYYIAALATLLALPVYYFAVIRRKSSL